MEHVQLEPVIIEDLVEYGEDRGFDRGVSQGLSKGLSQGALQERSHVRTKTSSSSALDEP